MKNQSIKSFACGVAIFLLGGCASRPYTGSVITQTVEPSGLTVTKAETRSILPGRILAGSESELQQMSADVLAIDLLTRQITLRTPDNNTQTFIAGDQVRNFSKIKVGDKVSIDYFTTVRFEVRPPSAEELARSQSPSLVFGRASQGNKPAGVVGVGDVAVLVIDAIDKSAQTVTLSGPSGPIIFKSAHPENLNLINRGDSVVVEVAELLAARVDPQS